MNKDFINALELGLQKYPRNNDKVFQYGTSGFRDNGMVIDHVLYRMGLLASLRSKANDGKTIGLMVTASHNPEEDNGVKLCDPKGEMLSKEWEELATNLVNAKNESLEDVLHQIIISNKINYDIHASVFLARDTRTSSIPLLNAALDGVKVLNGEPNDFGLLTTPQLHFLVCCRNYKFYGTPSTAGYYRKLSNSFENLRNQNLTKKRYEPVLYVDGANGVGGQKAHELASFIKTLKMHIINDGSTGVLNFQCGADFVKVEQKPPEGLDTLKGVRCASFDGDADRLVYFYIDKENQFHLLDGDKISGLIAKFLKNLIEMIGSDFVMRVIQTAYANGSSTIYIEDVLKIPVICVPTGVKHLHHEALNYDIGVYFEANGHGTVVFSDEAKGKIREIAFNESASRDQQMAAKKLLNVIDLINEIVGDAISDMLLVEVILCDLDWTIEDWDSIYNDLSFCLLKAKVPDRQAVVTSDADRICLKPNGLQKALNAEVSKYKGARSFVRPSGTEDVVRIYAEAGCKEDAFQLAQAVCELVKTYTKEIQE